MDLRQYLGLSFLLFVRFFIGFNKFFLLLIIIFSGISLIGQQTYPPFIQNNTILTGTTQDYHLIDKLTVPGQNPSGQTFDIYGNSIMRAGEEILFLDGFEVYSGSEFLAEIVDIRDDNCSVLGKSSIDFGTIIKQSSIEPSSPDEIVITSARVLLNYSRNDQTDLEGGTIWDYKVVVKVYSQSDPSIFNIQELRIQFGADGEYVYLSQALFENISGSTIMMEVVSLNARYSTDGGSSYTALNGSSVKTSGFIPEDIDLEFCLSYEYYSYLSPSLISYIDYDPNTEIISWPAQAEAKQYDIEWVYIDKEDEDYDLIKNGSSDAAFSYKEGTRVRTSDLSLFLPLIYPEGMVYFRARPVGRFVRNVNGDYSHVKTGSWGYGSLGGGVTRHEITQGFEPDHIWQYQVTYAEEGKNKRLLSYYDGSLRQRQILTNINSEDVTMIAETKYDHEGRAAVSILPAPVSGFDLRYKENFNKALDNSSFEKEHFDKANPEALSSLSGAAQYYSTSNTLVDDAFRSTLPRSGGYSYVQTLFVNDNTGRVRASSGVGPSHKLGSGHESKMYYGTPTSTELHRLFGENVGVASHYKKTLSLDPNGQGSVSYFDQQGRTIATALVGDAPDNLISISPGQQDITVSMVDNNVADLANGEIVATHKILNQAPTSYTFNYQLDGAFFVQTIIDPSNGSSSTSLCLDCKYELEISITDPDGTEISLTSVLPTAGITNKINKTYTSEGATCTAAGTYSFAKEQFLATFSKVGEYIVSKTLRVIVDEADIDSEVDEALGDLGISLQGLIDTHLANIVESDCDYTCADHCLTRVLEANPSWVVGVDDALIDAAVEQCKDTWCLSLVNSNLFAINANGESKECEALRAVMEGDVSPGGWMFESDNGSNGSKSSFWLSMDGQITAGDFLLADGITVATQAQVYDPLLWNDSWSTVAIESHREYCHYESCVELQSSKDYDISMILEQNWTDGHAAGYTRPETSPNKDPFMDLTLPSTMTLFGTSYSSGTSYSLIMSSQLTGYQGSTDLHSFANTSTSAIYSGSAPFTDRNKYLAFVSIYGSIKQDLIEQIKSETPCGYYGDDQAIFSAPEDISDPSVQNSLSILANDFLEGGCDELCEMNVISWMLQLEDLYPLIMSDPVKYAAAEAALLDFCLNNPDGCSQTNPFGLITDNFYGGNNSSDLISAFSNIGITNLNETTLVVTDPYDPCVNPNQYISRPSDFSQAFYYTLQNHVFPTSSGQSNITVQIDSLFDNSHRGVLSGLGITQLDGPNSGNYFGFDGEHCAVYLFDPSGVAINMNTITSISSLAHNPSPSITAPSNPPTGNPYTYTEISFVCSLSGGGSTTAYLYYISSNVTPGFGSGNCYPSIVGFVTVDTIPCVGSIDGSLIPQSPILNTAELKEDCLEFLRLEATHNAEQEYLGIREDIRNQILLNYYAQCLGSEQDEMFTAAYSLKEYHYTLYYYDMAGSLVQTVPPEGVDILGSTSFNVDGSFVQGHYPAHRLESKYKYNSLGQVREQETPDGGKSDFFYNSVGQLRYSQNAQQYADDDFSYTKYDALGRIIEVGESNTVLEGAGLTASLGDMSYPSTTAWDVNRTFYNESLYTLPAGYFKTGQQDNVRNRVASATYAKGNKGTAGMPLSSDITAASHYSYDIHGNVKELVQERNVLARTGTVVKQMAYDYDLLSGNVNEVNYQQGFFDEFNHRYSYDGDNRIIEVETSKDSYLWEKQAHYYYHLHGPLARTEIGQDIVQAQDYSYTLQGWLKSVNATSGRDDLDPGKDGYVADANNTNRFNARDAYGYSLGYYQHDGLSEGDYTALSSNHIMSLSSSDMDPSITSGAAKHFLYNGNIGHLTYALPTTAVGQSMNVMLKAFEYDQLNRIRSMKTMQSATGGVDNYKTNNGIGQGEGFDLDYESTYSYDANGNILSLTRNGYTDGVQTAMSMDNMSYSYGVDGNGELLNNRLRGVADGVNNGNYSNDFDNNAGISYTPGAAQISDNYQYDNIGNLMEDKTEEIASIEWNVSGKVDKITRTSGSNKDDLEFIYGPTGNRIAKIRKPRTSGNPSNANQWIITNYVRDASGNVMAAYEETFEVISGGDNTYKVKEKVKERSIYGSSRLGISRPISGSPGDVGEERNFAGIATTSGFGLVTTATNNHSLGDGSFIIQPSGGGLTLNNTTMTIYTLTALGDDIALIAGSGFTVLSGNLSQNGDLYNLPKGGVATVSNTNATSITINSNGSFGLNTSTNTAVLSASTVLNIASLSTISDAHYSERELGYKSYELTDHLGNVLATVSDRKIGMSLGGTYQDWEYYAADVRNANDYYPFGMVMPGRKYQSSDEYRYGFNGHEKDNEVKGSGNHYDLGLRHYDPRLGRMMSRDPRAPEYPWQTPYAYHRNNPIKVVDHLGGGDPPDPPSTLYHNTTKGDKIAKSGFDATTYGEKSIYNWFSTTENAAGTSRQGTSGTLAVDGINTCEAHVITKSQTKAWSAEAMKEMGYTKETWKAAAKTEGFKALEAERRGRMWSKVGQYMDKMGKDVYMTELDGNFAVSDKVANSGKITQMSGKSAKSWIKNLNGTKIAGRTFVAATIAMDIYRISTSQNVAKTTTKVVFGWGGASLGAATFAGAALAAGQMGPQIAAPEEIITVPVAGLVGGIVGYFWGEEVGEVTYEILESQGWVPGGQE